MGCCSVKQQNKTKTTLNTSLKLLWDRLIYALHAPFPSHAHIVTTISDALLTLPQHLRTNIWPSGIK